MGKTTTAVNLGASVADAGYPTLLVDLDPQCNATVALGLPEGQHPERLRVPLGRLTLDEAARPSGHERLDAVSSTPDLAGANVELPRMAGSETCLRDALGHGARPLPAHAARLPALARPAHGQRARGRGQRDRAGADRVLRARGPRRHARHPRPDPARAQPAPHHLGNDPDDARRPDPPRARGGEGGARALPPARLRHRDPAQRAPRRGAELRRARCSQHAPRSAGSAAYLRLAKEVAARA